MKDKDELPEELDEIEIEEEEEDDKKRRLKLFLLFIIVFIALFLGVYFGIQLYTDFVVDKPIESTTISQDTTLNEQGLADNPIDFDSLQAQNEDIYAYLVVPGTNVDYPICQSIIDDEFYLKHKAEDKSWSASGAVYTEMSNRKDFSDNVTLIYGHNGYSDTFFTTLHRFEKEDFFNEQPYFYIYAPGRKLTYQVMSAFKYDDRHILNSFRFSDTTVLLDFQQMLLNPNSAVKNTRQEQELEAPLNKDSKIVILSTCVTNQKSSRYLVCGVLVKDEKTN